MTAPPGSGLAGRRIAVTRAAGQASDLLALLRARGAEPVACPTIAVEPPESLAPLDDALRALGRRYDWVTFTSANAVAALADRLAALGVQLPARLRLAAVGVATARLLAERLRAPDFVPRVASAEALAAEIRDVAGRRVLFPRGNLASDTLARTLRARGATVDEVIAYRTVTGGGAADLARLVRAGDVDAILFMSGSSVSHFLDALRDDTTAPTLGPGGPAVVCIGPETARAAREGGIEVSAVADESTATGVVEALEWWFGRSGDVEGR
ncbi:MAG: uroporphyrinogen-III synthase [Gemmatimonadaceae bacterium]